ncbi:hypothetical protein WJX73_010593 [Symbiochloris irregularis]|uniref:Uncharacterized protein n=1 Tax=Symbiochloris irregularis TaxID=706552 RepID=A0AAW1PQW6_9CHLO
MSEKAQIYFAGFQELLLTRDPGANTESAVKTCCKVTAGNPGVCELFFKGDDSEYSETVLRAGDYVFDPGYAEVWVQPADLSIKAQRHYQSGRTDQPAPSSFPGVEKIITVLTPSGTGYDTTVEIVTARSAAHVFLQHGTLKYCTVDKDGNMAVTEQAHSELAALVDGGTYMAQAGLLSRLDSLEGFRATTGEGIERMVGEYCCEVLERSHPGQQFKGLQLYGALAGTALPKDEVARTNLLDYARVYNFGVWLPNSGHTDGGALPGCKEIVSLCLEGQDASTEASGDGVVSALKNDPATRGASSTATSACRLAPFVGNLAGRCTPKTASPRPILMPSIRQVRRPGYVPERPSTGALRHII